MTSHLGLCVHDLREATSGSIDQWGLDLGAGIALLGYSAALNRRISPFLHIPSNFAVAGLATAAVRMLGASWDDLGLAPSRVGRGLRAGLIAATPLLVGTAITAVTPRTGRHFDDVRVRNVEHPTFEILFRIPLGTALSEELIFRGALLALFERRHSRLQALGMTSALFGLWHVLPALDSIATNVQRRREIAAPLTVAGTVVATATVGAGFVWLRRRSDSLLAPVLVHAAVNAGAFIAVRFQQRQASSPPVGR